MLDSKRPWPWPSCKPASTPRLKSSGWRAARLCPIPRRVAAMDGRACGDRPRRGPECVWLLEHPSIYTAGTSADPRELLAPDRFPVFKTGRGGRFTYHGPGQRVAYVMLDLIAARPRRAGLRAALEDWLIATLARLGVEGERRRPGRHLRRGRQDRQHRRARAPLGQLPWRQPQRRSGSGALLRHRALRSERYAGHQPRRARRRDRHGAKSIGRSARLSSEIFG